MLVRRDVGDTDAATVATIAAGRLQAIVIPSCDESCSLCIINIHNHDVGAASINKLRKFKLKMQRARPPVENIAAGDYNFGADDDPTLHLSTDGRTIRYRDGREAQRWRAALDDISELIHHLPTRAAYRTTTAGRTLIHSRIDRIFTTIPPSTIALTQLTIRADDIRRAILTTSFAPASDHVPVRATVTLRPTLPPALRPIPRWITTHPLYAARV